MGENKKFLEYMKLNKLFIKDNHKPSIKITPEIEYLIRQAYCSGFIDGEVHQADKFINQESMYAFGRL